ncbi:DEAD/DEAH box helicase [Streptomyces sp. RPT161]|uniref:DEAD/DEAH box helicase n=1 Tax=Streptomyces sp. RPT161 TaxID=3015993 RepID=UPI003FCE310C
MRAAVPRSRPPTAVRHSGAVSIRQTDARPPSQHSAALIEEASILSTTTFRDLGILPETAEALEAVGITNPFPIQEMTLPVALAGNDVIGQAKTGTGKTLGFGLPLLERVTVPVDVEAGRAAPEALTDSPQALVVVPTRELCTQVTNDLLTAGKVRNVRVLAIYGGRAYEPQVEALKSGVDVVVGTPGRLLDLAGQRKLDLSAVRTLVLDEADEMLDLGFLPDVEKIMDMLPKKRQTMLFSATMPGQVISLARRYMSQPTHIRATAPDDEGATVANITQHVFRAHSLDKPELVARVLQAEGRGLAMIFCRTKRTAADIAEQLARRGFASGAVHGDLGQGAREQALRAFRNGKVDVLVCTDVAARGIDVDGVTHVINYQTPEDEKTYLHRIGRTGRAGASGTALTLVDWDDIPRWQLINKALDLSFHEPLETYSTSPHLYEALGIPEGTKGVLPRAARTRAGLAAEEIEDLGETGGRGRGRKSAPAAETERPKRERTPRQRRRTRSGEPVVEAAEAAATQAAAPVAEESESRPAPRRRRRTRGGGALAATPKASAAEVAPKPEEAALAAVPAPALAPASEEAPPAPRRRRTRKAATAEVVAEETAPAPQTPAEEAPAPQTPAEEAAPAPRRRTRKAAAAKVADAAEAVAEEAAPAPRRTRKKAVAEAVEQAPAEAPAAEAVTEEAAPAPRRRTRKAAAAEVTEAVAEQATPAPRRTRKTAAAKAAETAPAEETTPAARRTRKATAKAPTAEVATEEAAPAPRRRTRKAAAAEVTEAVAEQATPAPRRTRKTAAAKAAETAPAEETTPAARRTRKATAKAPTAEAATEEATPRRRTRKAAAKAPVEA